MSRYGLCSYSADYGSEKFLKRLIGRTDVEAALLRLDLLTQEEIMVVVARNLAVTHHVDDINVAVEDVDGLVKAIKESTQSFLSLFVHVLTLLPIVFRTGIDKQQRSLLLRGTIVGRPT